jgi:ATP/maltotriose-dependent transcriptional regulator MalT
VLAWPLTGREAELKRIGGFLSDGVVGGVVLYGEAGVGKTRLARDAVARAATEAAVTRWAVGTATAADIPLGAVAHLVSVPQEGPLPSPFVLLRQAAEKLAADAEGRQLVVGVDDAHLLDPLSALLIQQLALTGAARLVLTVRSGMPVPDALASLWKDDVLGRFLVAPLSQTQTSLLIQAALGGPVESITLGHLWDVTQGNPLFLRHVVEGEIEAGRLVQTSGVWRWRGTMAVGAALTDLVEARLSGLDPDARLVLDHLAFAEPLGVQLLEDLVGAGAGELNRLERWGLIRTEAGARRFETRLAHPVFGEVLRAEASPSRARAVTFGAAEAIARHGLRRDGDVLKVATLRMASGAAGDPLLLTRAAAMAFGLFDIALSERLCRAAIAAGAGLDAQFMLAIAMSFSGRPEEADEELQRASALVKTPDDVARIAIARVANLFWTLRRPAESEQVLTEAEAATQGSRRAGLELRGLRAALECQSGRQREAVETANEVLGAPDASDMATVWAAAAVANAWARMGAGERASEAAAAGMDAVRRTPEASVLEGALVWGDLMGELLGGRLAEATEKALRCQQRFLQMHPTSVSAIGAVGMGTVALARGSLKIAGGWFREVLAAPAGHDAAAWKWLGHIYATQSLGMAGDAEGARRALKESEQARHPSLTAYEPDHRLAQAWVAAAEGVVSEACDKVRAAAAVAASQGVSAVEVHAWHTLVRMGGAGEAAEALPHLVALAEVVQGPMAPIAARHAKAASERDAESLDAVACEFEAMGAELLAADAFAHAADAHGQAGSKSRATASGRKARALAERCGSARTPALAAVEVPLPISDREREVVLLAASGLSNREIAQRLVVSVRTVESHLYQASAKLGVAGREGLLEVLGPPPGGRN